MNNRILQMVIEIAECLTDLGGDIPFYRLKEELIKLDTDLDNMQTTFGSLENIDD